MFIMVAGVLRGSEFSGLRVIDKKTFVSSIIFFCCHNPKIKYLPCSS